MLLAAALRSLCAATNCSDTRRSCSEVVAATADQLAAPFHRAAHDWEAAPSGRTAVAEALLDACEAAGLAFELSDAQRLGAAKLESFSCGVLPSLLEVGAAVLRSAAAEQQQGGSSVAMQVPLGSLAWLITAQARCLCRALGRVLHVHDLPVKAMPPGLLLSWLRAVAAALARMDECAAKGAC